MGPLQHLAARLLIPDPAGTGCCAPRPAAVRLWSLRVMSGDVTEFAATGLHRDSRRESQGWTPFPETKGYARAHGSRREVDLGFAVVPTTSLTTESPPVSEAADPTEVTPMPAAVPA